MKKEKSCGAVIIRNDSQNLRFLLIHQVQGHWCFPKGHVEGQETEHETAVREIREETGLEVSFIDGFQHKLSYSPNPDVWKDVIYFLAEYKGGREQVQREELTEMEWVSEEEAKKRITFDNDRDLLQDAVSFLKKEDPDHKRWLPM